MSGLKHGRSRELQQLLPYLPDQGGAKGDHDPLDPRRLATAAAGEEEDPQYDQSRAHDVREDHRFAHREGRQLDQQDVGVGDGSCDRCPHLSNRDEEERVSDREGNYPAEDGKDRYLLKAEVEDREKKNTGAERGPDEVQSKHLELLQLDAVVDGAERPD